MVRRWLLIRLDSGEERSGLDRRGDAAGEEMRTLDFGVSTRYAWSDWMPESGSGGEDCGTDDCRSLQVVNEDDALSVSEYPLFGENWIFFSRNKLFKQLMTASLSGRPLIPSFFNWTFR